VNATNFRARNLALAIYKAFDESFQARKQQCHHTQSVRAHTLCFRDHQAILLPTYIVSLNLPEFATTLANVTPILVTTSLVVNTKKAKFSFNRSSDPFGWLTATISQHHATWEHAPVQSIHI